MAEIKMKNSVTVAETFLDFLTGKKAAGVSEKTLLTYGQHFSAVSKHLSPDTPMDALDKSDLEAMISSMRDAGLAANSMMFPHDGKVDVVLPFGKAVLEPVKLAAWQIMAYPDCRAVFFSDYIPSRLRGKEVRLPFTKNLKKGGHTHNER